MKQFSSAGIAKLFGLTQEQVVQVMQNYDYPLPTDDLIEGDDELTKNEIIMLYYYLRNKGLNPTVPDSISNPSRNPRKEF